VRRGRLSSTLAPKVQFLVSGRVSFCPMLLT
jgi:hypothetical protein